MAAPLWDVVIVGAGPAGLSAALVLGRACRKVLLCDRGTPRNWASQRMHAFLSRDGIEPRKFRELSHRQLARYPQVKFRAARVTAAQLLPDSTFRVTFSNESTVRARKLLLATGLFDRLPPLKGIEKFFGTSIFQCPYCHGWEHREQAVAVYGQGRRGFEMARAMTAWTRDIALCTNGGPELSAGMKRELQRNAIQLYTAPIVRLSGSAGQLKRIVFQDGAAIARTALFFDTPSTEQSNLARSIGCQFSGNGGVKCGAHLATSVPGVFVAGNIVRDVQLAIVAAAEGTRAAFGINRALTREDFSRRVTGEKRVEHAFPK
jgi:thioredoxin reductase